MLKKLLAPLLAALMLLSGCAQAPKDQSLTVVAAIFPEYDWVRQIIGDTQGVQLRLLVDDGVDPHSFQPTVGDMVLAADCDLLIYGGGESDEWLEDVIDEAKPGQIALELMAELGERTYTAEYTEGMQVREEEDETDEHFWLSLRNAILCCQRIADTLSQLDPGNAESYQRNCRDYCARLEELDGAYQEMVDTASCRTLLVCDRFPFRYLAEDYDLSYYAAFPGCSAESGASFTTIVFLTKKMEDLQLHTLLISEGSDSRIAQTVAASSGIDADILVLDSMQSVSDKDAETKTYYDTMQQNLLVLKAALN